MIFIEYLNQKNSDINKEVEFIKNAEERQFDEIDDKIRAIVDQIESLKIFYNEDSLAIRDYAMVAATDESIKDYLRAGTFESDRLTVRSFKLMADGALGSRGACLLHPYNDAPTNGFLLQDPEEFDRIIKRFNATYI